VIYWIVTAHYPEIALTNEAERVLNYCYPFSLGGATLSFLWVRLSSGHTTLYDAPDRASPLLFSLFLIWAKEVAWIIV